MFLECVGQVVSFLERNILINLSPFLSVDYPLFPGGGVPVSKGIQWEVLWEHCRRVSRKTLFPRGAVPVKVRAQPVHLWRVSG